MDILSKEIINALEPAEEFFRQVSVGYKRNSPHALDVQVYEALKSVNPNEPKPNYSCSKCIFDLYCKCAKVYNDSKEFYKNEQPEQPEPKPAETIQEPTSATKPAITNRTKSRNTTQRKNKKIGSRK